MPRLSLARVTTDALKKELTRRLEALPKLIAQRDALNRQIAELGALSAAEKVPEPAKAPAPAPKKRGRKAKARKGAVSLGDALAEAIQAKGTLSVADASKAVLAAGYKTKSKNFSTLVSMILSGDERFERVSRGVYRVKS